VTVSVSGSIVPDRWPADSSQPSALPTSRALGQLIVAPVEVGTPASPPLLTAIRKGRIRSVVLFGSGLGAQVVHSVADQLQSAARTGGNPGLLIMTDQEGVEVKRLAGPPILSASQMGNPTVAAQQGVATGALLNLKSAGVNVDLAPVADVSRTPDGFITVEHQSFGTNPSAVGSAVCALADGLKLAAVAYTLKHYPGRGDAIQSTDIAPVTITEPAQEINADDEAYRRCGHGPLALVMVNNASYSNITGSTPAGLSPTVYGRVMRQDGINAVTISDSLNAGAIAPQPHLALRALRTGLDLLLYTGSETDVADVYTSLSADIRSETGRSASAVAIERPPV
jgi:beta-N-acetylhexosaminidase